MVYLYQTEQYYSSALVFISSCLSETVPSHTLSLHKYTLDCILITTMGIVSILSTSKHKVFH